MIWLALIIYLACLLGGVLFVVLEGLGLWRALKGTGRAFSAEVGRISQVAEGIQVHIERLNGSSGALKAAIDRITVSRARLDVQLRAIREARQTIGRLLWFLPGA